MPHNISDWFSLLGATTFVWIVARLAIKGLYRLICWWIRKTEADQDESNNAS